MWAVAKFASGFEFGNTVIAIMETQSGQLMGVVKTDNKEQALSVLAQFLEPEDPTEALEWLKGNTKLEAYSVLDPK